MARSSAGTTLLPESWKAPSGTASLPAAATPRTNVRLLMPRPDAGGATVNGVFAVVQWSARRSWTAVSRV